MNEHGSHDRRSFLKSMGVGAGVVGGASALLGGTQAAEAAGIRPEASAPTATSPLTPYLEFGIENPVNMGRLKSYEGGGFPAWDVTIEDNLNADRYRKKHVGGVKYEDITITCGVGMGDAFSQWVADTLAGKATTMDGAVVFVTNNLNTHSRLHFSNALITEVGFPALDASSKDAAKMTIKITPEATFYTRVIEKWTPSPAAARQKAWLCSNFKLEIDGLDTSKVSKISAITITQKADVGILVDTPPDPNNLEISNPVVTFPEAHAAEFFDWWSKMDETDDSEKAATITWLAPDRKTVLGKISLANMGVVQVELNAKNSGHASERYSAELYCEEVSYTTPLPSG